MQECVYWMLHSYSSHILLVNQEADGGTADVVAKADYGSSSVLLSITLMLSSLVNQLPILRSTFNDTIKYIHAPRGTPHRCCIKHRVT
jgi:hypothetical protein